MNFRILHISLLFLILSCLVIGPRNVQADPNEIVLKSIKAQSNHDSLSFAMTIADLFSSKSLSTLQSGIQSLVKIDIELQKHNSDGSLISTSSMVDRYEIYRKLSYNIWDEQYYVIDQYGKKNFDNLDDFISYTCSIHNYPLTLLSALEQTAKYSLRVMVEFFPISEEQSGKVEAWLKNPHRTKYTIASDENANRFQFSSSKLVSLFLGNKNRPENTSKWYTSKIFSFNEVVD